MTALQTLAVVWFAHAVGDRPKFDSCCWNSKCDAIAKRQTNLFFKPRFGTPIFLQINELGQYSTDPEQCLHCFVQCLLLYSQHAMISQMSCSSYGDPTPPTRPDDDCLQMSCCQFNWEGV